MTGVPLPLVIAWLAVMALAVSLIVEDTVRRWFRRNRPEQAETPKVSTAEKERRWLADTDRQRIFSQGPAVDEALDVLATAEERLADFYR
jgi:hypothetical protein